jgi:hypothetical protein
MNDPIFNTPPTQEQLDEARNSALNASHPNSWVWNDEKISWVAPIDPPTDGYPYLWDEDTLAWIPFPDYPR